ncbi:hypothetical protein [Glaciihabitans sp. dw_435]|uniref:hypothetical protein n=1 Tax=Glaciihabitans sp. dw_435 TaxID=2720081 RepID=UPI001BD37B4B|nr:hypothetical protein [Glaciihabitans sp. dw_435]
MISVEGASLIAQVFPVGFIVLALEARILRVDPSDILGLRISKIVTAALGYVGLIGGITVVGFCVYAVSESRPLSEGESWGAWIFGTALSIAVSSQLGLMYLDKVIPPRRTKATDSQNSAS